MIIAGLWRCGDWRHVATGCNALVFDDNDDDDVTCCVSAASKEPVAPISVPAPQPAPPGREVTIQFQQAPAPTAAPPPGVAPPTGVTTTTAWYREEEAMEAEPGEEPPRFTLPLRNQTVTDGDRAVLRVFFSGVPAPSVTWYFNSQPVRPGQDFQINVDVRRGESTLVIVCLLYTSPSPRD